MKGTKKVTLLTNAMFHLDTENGGYYHTVAVVLPGLVVRGVVLCLGHLYNLQTKHSVVTAIQRDPLWKNDTEAPKHIPIKYFNGVLEKTLATTGGSPRNTRQRLTPFYSLPSPSLNAGEEEKNSHTSTLIEMALAVDLNGSWADLAETSGGQGKHFALNV